MKTYIDLSKPYTMDIHGNINYRETPIVETTKETPTTDVSLDDIGKRIVLSLERAVKHLSVKITGGEVDRDVIGALKDCSAMLKELKQNEKDFLSEATDEQLTEMLKK